jgi:hypothetical protein
LDDQTATKLQGEWHAGGGKQRRECVPAGCRGKPITERTDRFGRQAPRLQFPSRAAPGWKGELCLEERGGLLVQGHQRLPFGRRFAVFSFWTDVWNRHPQSVGHQAHGLREGHVVLEFHELEDVAPFPTPETLEDALIRIHVEGRRALLVKRTEALPGRPHFAQRRNLIDEGDQIDLRAKVVDERLRKERHGSVLQLHNGRAPAALVVGRR